MADGKLNAAAEEAMKEADAAAAKLEEEGRKAAEEAAKAAEDMAGEAKKAAGAAAGEAKKAAEDAAEAAKKAAEDAADARKDAGTEKKPDRKKDPRGVVWRDRRRIWCGLPWTFTVYSLSPDRLFIERGFLNREEDEVRLYRIRDVSLRRSFFQRIFGLGTINICSNDSNLRDFQLVNVKNSRSVKEQLSQFIEADRQRKRVTAREIMGGHGGHDEPTMEEFLGPMDGMDMDPDDDTHEA